MFPRYQKATVVASLIASLAASTAFAGNLTPVIVTSEPVVPVGTTGKALAFPSIFGAASAIPAPGGTQFVALTYVNPRGGIEGADGDGDLALGTVFGSPVDSLSLTLGVNITSLEDDFADSGSFNLGLSRMIATGSRSATFIGASAGSLGGWGDAEADEEAYSVQVSHLMGVGAADIPVQITAGYGNLTTLSDDGLGTLEEGLFYGIGAGVTEALSVSVSGTQTQVNLGATATLGFVDGLSVTAGVYDVTENVERQQYAVTVGFSF